MCNRNELRSNLPTWQIFLWSFICLSLIKAVIDMCLYAVSSLCNVPTAQICFCVYPQGYKDSWSLGGVIYGWVKLTKTVFYLSSSVSFWKASSVKHAIYLSFVLMLNEYLLFNTGWGKLTKTVFLFELICFLLKSIFCETRNTPVVCFYVK